MSNCARAWPRWKNRGNANADRTRYRPKPPQHDSVFATAGARRRRLGRDSQADGGDDLYRRKSRRPLLFGPGRGNVVGAVSLYPPREDRTAGGIFRRPGERPGSRRRRHALRSGLGDAGVSLDDALTFMRKVEQLTGARPALYSGHVLKEALGGKPNAEIASYRLWLAQYSSAPTLPVGFDSYWLWQYSESASVPGIAPPVDVNAYDGTEDELRADWSGTPAPEPGPEPEAVVTITVTAPPGVKVVVYTEESS